VKEREAKAVALILWRLGGMKAIGFLKDSTKPFTYRGHREKRKKALEIFSRSHKKTKEGRYGTSSKEIARARAGRVGKLLGKKKAR